MPELPDNVAAAYAGTAGLKDDFDAIVESLEFRFDSEYNDGKTMIAALELVTDDGDEPTSSWFSTGSGWEPADKKGRSAQLENGNDPRGFNRSSGWQTWVAAALELDGFTDELESRGYPMPWQAEFAEGLAFHFEQVEYKPLNHKDGDQLPTRLLPTAFLGNGDGKKAGKTTARKGTTTAKPARTSKAAAKDDDEDGDAFADLPAKVRGKLKKLAQESGDHDTFMEKAYEELPDADDYESIIEDASDDGFYAQNAE